MPLKRFVCIMAGIEISEVVLNSLSYLTCRNCIGCASFVLKVYGLFHELFFFPPITILYAEKIISNS